MQEDSGTPRFEVADIFNKAFASFCAKHGCSTNQFKAANAIMACRTEKLGAHKFICDKCGHEIIDYNSCRNRHCPKCQGSKRWKWATQRIKELLPIPYYHVVFTMPHSINTIALFNKKIIYNLFFDITADALNTFANNKKFLGAKIGFVGILHTWGQNLATHIHIHYIITGGGITHDKKMWKHLPYRKEFIFPVKAMSRYIRKRFTEWLMQYYNQGELVIPEALAELNKPFEFMKFNAKLAAEKWVCYAKKPFAQPDLVLKYVARYTHRVAIANQRIIKLDDNTVTFKYKQYKNGDVEYKVMTLSHHEFIRRFLNHVLPAGFRKIRHFGFFCNGVRKHMIDLAKKLLDVKDAENDKPNTFIEEFRKCPKCGKGVLTFCNFIDILNLAPG